MHSQGISQFSWINSVTDMWTDKQNYFNINGAMTCTKTQYRPDE